MKIAICGQDEDLASPVACHFGRCYLFHIYDDETGINELFENCERDKKECAGVSILHCLMDKNVRHIISANFGKRVQREMVENDIRMTLLTDCSKTVGDIIRIIQRKRAKKGMMALEATPSAP
jgi:predicted Fe-Mo cluster-binding NifX family protein